MDIILASASSRRYELLKKVLFELGIEKSFSVIKPNIDETQLPGENPYSFVKRLSQEKATHVQKHVEEKSIILAADTIVYKNTVFGKPKDDNDAISMLTKLSDTNHEVITGYTLINTAKDKTITDYVVTQITFKPLSEQEIKDYVDSKEPMDKAGAYAIQGLARNFVTTCEGSRSNVIGLPTENIKKILNNWVFTD